MVKKFIDIYNLPPFSFPNLLNVCVLEVAHKKYEDDFKSISAQIDQLSKRITAIRESESEDGDLQARLKEIQDIIDKRRENKDIYDDSIVRQMVECIKVYHDGRLQIILGGGYELEEHLESKLG